jgi:rod shape-determining protein MreD
VSHDALNRVPMLLSVLAGLILSVLPLPHWLNIARPDFLVIVVLYWSIMVPRAGGLTLAFLAGLLLDAFKGVVLGQHALALCLASYIAIKLHLRVRIFPVWHQALTVFWLLAVYQFMLFWIDGMTGHPITTYARWIPAVTGAALWPVFAGLLGNAYQRT